MHSLGKKAIMLVIIAVIMISGTGCYSSYDMDKARKEAYSEGYQDGYQEGYDQGCEDGYEQGAYEGYEWYIEEGQYEDW